MSVRAPAMRWLLVAAVLLGCSMSSAKPDASDVRILFLTDCTPYSDWMSIALVYSYLYSGHKGPITRVMCCTEKDRKRYNPDLLTLVETHIAPSVRVSKRTGDNYAAYDKPGAVIDYIQKVTPPEDWLLVLDSDMIVRQPVRTEDYNVSLGWAVGSRYNYMIGVSNALADRHIPEIPRRNDSFAGPEGRRSDMVGGFFLIHKTDLKRMSKLWLQYAEDVRADPEAYKYAGDSYAVKPGDKPWISEMYGYSYGAAKANVWHHWDDTTMLYPGYNPLGVPKVLHFGLQWSVEGYTFDKHWYVGFDARKCAPWDLGSTHPQQGLFHHPPRPSELTSKTFGDRYRDLIALEGVATLNAGLCWWHRKRCPANEQMGRECEKADQIFFEVRESLRLAEKVYGCLDTQPKCPEWAASGECEKNQGYMARNCRPACKLCTPDAQVEGILDRLSNPRGERMVPQEIPNPPVIPAEFQDQIQPAQGVDAGGVHKDLPPVATVTRQPVKHHRNEPTAGRPEQPTGNTPTQAEPTKHYDGQVAGAHKHEGQAHRGHREPGRHYEEGHQQPKGRGGQEEVVVAPPKATAHGEEGAQQPVTAHRHHDDHDDHVVVKHPGSNPQHAGELKALLRKCHRMGGMTMEEVKACVAAAKEGHPWVRKDLPHHQAPIRQTLAKDDSEQATPTRVTSSRYVPSQLGSSLLPISMGQTALVLMFFVVLLLLAIPRRAARRRRAQQQYAGTSDTLPGDFKSS